MLLPLIVISPPVNFPEICTPIPESPEPEIFILPPAVAPVKVPVTGPVLKVLDVVPICITTPWLLVLLSIVAGLVLSNVAHPLESNVEPAIVKFPVLATIKPPTFTAIEEPIPPILTLPPAKIGTEEY